MSIEHTKWKVLACAPTASKTAGLGDPLWDAHSATLLALDAVRGLSRLDTSNWPPRVRRMVQEALTALYHAEERLESAAKTLDGVKTASQDTDLPFELRVWNAMTGEQRVQVAKDAGLDEKIPLFLPNGKVNKKRTDLAILRLCHEYIKNHPELYRDLIGEQTDAFEMSDFLLDAARIFASKYAKTRFTQGTPEIRNMGDVTMLRVMLQPYNAAHVDSLYVWHKGNADTFKVQVSGQSPSDDAESQGFTQAMAEDTEPTSKFKKPADLAEFAFKLSKKMS